MNLEEGMYVRTKQGHIYKLSRYEEDYNRWISSGESDWQPVYESLVTKASYNIIDLIEVGDIITTNNLCGEVTHVEGDKIYTTCYDGEYCYDYQIQSILTREQYESMKYEVK